MWKTLRNFIFKENNYAQEIEKSRDYTPQEKSVEDVDNSVVTIIDRALAHYCELCDRGFKTPGARGAHVRLKHGN